MTVDKTYWTLVRAALWGERATWPEEETEALLQMNAQQGTGALVYPMVLAQEGLDKRTRARMKAVCVQTMQQQVKLQHTLEMAWKVLEKAGIEPVLLKGAGLAALYPEPQRRTWGDIDLFVGKAHYHQACATMRAAFPEAWTFDEELEHYKHYNVDVEDVPVELHRVTVSLQHPLDVRRYNCIEQYGMIHGEWFMVNDLKVKVPEPTFNVLFVFLHSWQHMIGGSANVRQLCDLALLLHHYAGRIDKERLERWLKDLHLYDVWLLFAYCLQYCLGLPAEETLFSSEKVAERAEALIKEQIIKNKEQIIKNKEQRIRNRLVRKWGTMKERFRVAKRVKRYSPVYARHMNVTTLLHGAARLFAKDRKWE